MYIQRVLLLTAILLAVFAPTLGDWIFSPPAPWYRPFSIWLLIIVAIYASQRRSRQTAGELARESLTIDATNTDRTYTADSPEQDGKS